MIDKDKPWLEKEPNELLCLGIALVCALALRFGLYLIY